MARIDTRVVVSPPAGAPGVLRGERTARRCAPQGTRDAGRARTAGAHGGGAVGPAKPAAPQADYTDGAARSGQERARTVLEELG